MFSLKRPSANANNSSIFNRKHFFIQHFLQFFIFPLPEALLIDFLIEWSGWQQNESNETFNKHFGSVITDRLVVAADCLCNSNKPSMIHKKYWRQHTQKPRSFINSSALCRFLCRVPASFPAACNLCTQWWKKFIIYRQKARKRKKRTQLKNLLSDEPINTIEGLRDSPCVWMLWFIMCEDRVHHGPQEPAIKFPKKSEIVFFLGTLPYAFFQNFQCWQNK